MVLTVEQYNYAIEKVETNLTLSRLFDLRTTTKSYIIQCLADREIQKIVKKNVLFNVNDGDRYRHSLAYGHNSKVIHTPHYYSRAEAADGLGWNSHFSQPIQCRWIFTDVEDQNCKIWELEKQLADKNKEIFYWKTAAESFRENQLRFESTREKFDQFKASLSRDIEDFFNTFGWEIGAITTIVGAFIFMLFWCTINRDFNNFRNRRFD